MHATPNPTSPGASASPIDALIERIESASALDAPARAIGSVARTVVSPRRLKDLLSGTWLGHAVHPLLTDVVIGSFLSATILDLLGGDRDGTASERLIAVGIASYGPTALTGVNDWADAEPSDAGVRRAGLVHAAANASALSLYAASLLARRAGGRRKGVLLGVAGATMLGAGGTLGGHLTYRKGVRVSRSAP